MIAIHRTTTELFVLIAAIVFAVQTGCKRNQEKSGDRLLPEERTKVMKKEAQSSITAIATAAVHLYHSPRVDGNGMMQGHRFPDATPLTPKQPCCKSRDLTCHSKQEDWSATTWQTLHFRPDAPHLLRYQFLSCNHSGHEGFLVRAVGSPACSQDYLVFEFEYRVDKEAMHLDPDDIAKKIRTRRAKSIPRGDLSCPK